MKTYHTSYIINAPIGTVAEFHQDSRAIKILTPPPVWIQIHDAQALSEGSRLDMTMWFGPFPVRWQAVHSEVDYNQGFTDQQISGPMKFWKHTHSFIRYDDNSTLMKEHIQYEHFSGTKGFVTSFLFSPPGLKWLFYYRKIKLNRIFSRKHFDSTPRSNPPLEKIGNK